LITRSTPMLELPATKSSSPHKLGLRARLRRFHGSRAKLMPICGGQGEQDLILDIDRSSHSKL
jgi:hypothetical protein